LLGTVGSDPQVSPSRGGPGPLTNTCNLDHISVPAKWHIPSIGFSRVHECDKRHRYVQTDRPRYGNMCRNRRCRCLKMELILIQSSNRLLFVMAVCSTGGFVAFWPVCLPSGCRYVRQDGYIFALVCLLVVLYVCLPEGLLKTLRCQVITYVTALLVVI